MAYKNNGYQRSLTFVVKRIVDGVVQSSTTYDGRLAFGSYGAINNEQLARMAYEDYQQRLKDFIAYVEDQVPGLDVEAALESGSAPRRYNTSSCPIGGSSSGGSGEGGDSSEGGGSGEGGDPDDSTNPEETLVITGPDSLTEGESYDYEASDLRAAWSIESGAMGSDIINVASGLLTTDGNVGQTRTLVIKASRGTSVGRKEVKVYAKDSGNGEETLVITGPDSLTEGESYDYEASDLGAAWSIESGAMGSDIINVASGLLTTDGNVGQTRTLVIKASRGTSVGRKEVKVYAKDSGNGEETLVITGPDEISEGDVVQYTSMPLAASEWSIVSGAHNDGINDSGQLITAIVGQERILKIKAESDDKFGTKEVFVKAATIGNL